MSWLSVIQRDWEFAQDMLSTDGDIPMMFILHCATFSRLVYAALDEGEDPALAFAFLRMLIIADQPIAITSFSEGWASRQRRGETAEQFHHRIAKVRPSQDPRAMRILQLTSVHPGDEGLVVTSKIGEVKRSRTGRVKKIVRVSLDNSCLTSVAEPIKAAMTREWSEERVPFARKFLKLSLLRILSEDGYVLGGLDLLGVTAGEDGNLIVPDELKHLVKPVKLSGDETEEELNAYVQATREKATVH